MDYDPSYQRLDYPMGDVPIHKGVCTDVVIRALRAGGLDLQKLVHEDMKSNFKKYPPNWGLKSTDKNIDHRRVPNLETLFKAKGWEVPKNSKEKDYRPGDIVTWKLFMGRDHIGILSNKLNGKGYPYIIHNIGRGAREDDDLFSWKIHGHFRVPLSPTIGAVQ